MKPIRDELAAIRLQDRYSTYPSNGLTPERLARILKKADGGDIYRQMELFEEIEEKDTHLMSVMGTRKNAVLGADYEVIAFSAEESDQEIASFVTDTMANIPDFDDALLDLLDAIGKGFAVTEILWELDKKQRVVPGRLKWRHQKRFRYDEMDVLRLITDSNSYPGEELPENKFIVHRYKARSGYNSRAGVFRTCVWMYLFKNYTVKDWVAFAEVYGMPIRLGKYDPSASEDDKEALAQALIQIGTDAAGLIPQSTAIEFIQAAKVDGDVYERLGKFCNAEISKAVLGQTQTSEVAASGSLASSKVHEEVRQDILEADCHSLAKRLRTDLIRPLVLYNFGSDAASRLPSLKFDCEKPENLEQVSKVYATLSGIGLPIAAQHVYERFGIPKPGEDDALLKPHPAPMQPNRLLSLKGAIGGFTDEQQALEHLADRSVMESLPIMEAILAPVLKLVAETDDLRALKEKLLGIYPKLDSSKLSNLAARAIFVAELYGRWSAGEK